jgi:hypothetical protein
MVCESLRDEDDTIERPLDHKSPHHDLIPFDRFLTSPFLVPIQTALNLSVRFSVNDRNMFLHV